MRPVVVYGRGRRPRRSADLSLEVVEMADLSAAANGIERVLVVGSTADVAQVAAAVPGAALAFAGANELCRLFALRPSLSAALNRLSGGAGYACDLGVVESEGAEFPFLAVAATGAGAGGGLGFPWARRRGRVAIATPKRETTITARALVVANAQHWRRWTIAPKAAPNDGRVEIQTFDGSAGALWSLRRTLALGLHVGSPAVTRVIAASAAIQVPASWVLRVDGVRIGHGGFRIRTVPGGASLLI